ncbi:MAG: hypothetical protein ACREKH_03885, partial [Candidatus Rokuibacteriota bacterium]
MQLIFHYATGDDNTDMEREDASMKRRHAVLAISALLLLAAPGCGRGPALSDAPATTGRRVQNVTVAAGGAVPYQVAAYEFVFADQPGVPHPRRAALVVDLFGDRGRVQGFAEWGRSGERPKTYAVGGWARHRAGEGQTLTVFDLSLNGL